MAYRRSARRTGSGRPRGRSGYGGARRGRSAPRRSGGVRRAARSGGVPTFRIVIEQPSTTAVSRPFGQVDVAPKKAKF